MMTTHLEQAISLRENLFTTIDLYENDRLNLLFNTPYSFHVL